MAWSITFLASPDLDLLLFLFFFFFLLEEEGDDVLPPRMDNKSGVLVVASDKASPLLGTVVAAAELALALALTLELELAMTRVAAARNNSGLVFPIFLNTISQDSLLA